MDNSMANAKIPKRKSRYPRPFFGSITLADTVNERDRKIDCLGLYTALYAWAFPCNRTLRLAFTLFSAPIGKTTCIAIARKQGKRRVSKLCDFFVQTEIGGNVAGKLEAQHEFEEPGIHEIVLKLIEVPARIIAPVEVIEKEWPEFTQKELIFAKKHPHIQQAARAVLHCSECKHAYIFEERVIAPKSSEGGILHFPENGIFECEDCGTTIKVRDLQGRMRWSLREAIHAEMRRLR